MIFDHHHSQSLVKIACIYCGLTLATTLGVVFSHEPANSQTIPFTIKKPAPVANPEIQRLYVNPQVGDNQQGDGSQLKPLATITHALQLAQPNTVIILAPGNYSTQTGEQFPLVMGNGVTLQGNSPSRGRNITISGGGRLSHQAVTGKTITIAMAESSQLLGVTVTNPETSGYGVWIGANNPVIKDSTFTRNGKAGIIVTGESHPNITNNHFLNNLGQGITIQGNSQGQIQNNILERTGFAINVSGNASPVISNNRFIGNRVGVVTEGNSQPVLRQNLISASTQDGIVAIAQSRPDFGSRNDPGGNNFRGNRRFDINNAVANQAIPVFGNQFTGKVSGNLDWVGGAVANGNSTALPLRNVSTAASQSQSQRMLPITKPVSGLVDTTPTNTNRESPQVTQRPFPPNQRNLEQTPNFNPQNGDRSRVNIDVPAPNPSNPPNTVPRTTPPSSSSGERRLADLLNLPPGNIPNFERGFSPPNYTIVPLQLPTITRNPSTSTPSNNTSSNTSRSNNSGQFLVFVETRNAIQEEILRNLVSSAFRTSYQGKSVMQVGRFNSRVNAQRIGRELMEKGFQVVVVPL